MLGLVEPTGDAAPLDLIGRDPELLAIDTAVRTLAEGRGGAMAVLGPAGVGKSRLARAAIGRASSNGVHVLTGRAVATGGSTPYRPLIEAVAPWARTHERDDVDLGAHSRAYDVLVPGSSSGSAEPLSPVFIAEALLRLLPRVSDGAPALLLLEDLHWADEETLAAVEYVADAVESMSVLIVVTARDDEGPVARRTIRALAARGAMRLLRLAPLDVEATRELAELRLGRPATPALTSLLVERAEGLPLFIEELLTALDASGSLTTHDEMVDVVARAGQVLPLSVADTVAARLEEMPDGHRRVVEAAALLGRSFEHGLVEGDDGAEVAPALQAATALGLVQEDPDRPGQLRFRHALLRDGVIVSTYPPRRAELARTLLDRLLVRDLSDDNLAVAIDLAVRAGDDTLAARLALRRAMDAFELWAMGTAERGLAEARSYAGKDPDLLIEIDIAALRVASIVGRLPVVMQLGQALLSRLDRSGRHDVELLETHLRLMQTLLDEEQWQEAEPHRQSAVSLMHAADDCHVTRLELWSSLLDRLRGDLDSARSRAVKAADLARPDPLQVDLVCCALLYEGRAWLPEDPDVARSRWQESLAYADTNGVRIWRARMLLELLTLEGDELRGDVDVNETLREVDALAQEVGGVATRSRAALVHAAFAVNRGDLTGLAEALSSAESFGIAGAAARRAHADLRAALSVLRQEPVGEMSPRAAVLAALAVDDVEVARSAASQLDRSVGRGPLALFIDLVTDHDAIDYGAVGDARSLLPNVAAAVERLAPATLVAAMFTRLHATGAAEERSALQSAVSTFDRLGLTRPADACRAMLRSAGVPLPRRPSAQDGVPEHLRAVGVTARELDVLRLLAEGYTNRDVAAALYLSPRTVEKHVERLLLKTGAPNRTALAALAPPNLASAGTSLRTPAPDGT